MSEKYQNDYEKMREAIQKCVKECKKAKIFTQKRIAIDLNKQEYEISNVLNGHKQDPELLMEIGDFVSQYRGDPWTFQQVYKDNLESIKKEKNDENLNKTRNIHDKIRFVIETSPVVDASLPEPAIFDGWEEAFKFCAMHNRQELLTMDRPFIDKSGNIIDYGDATILFLFEMLTCKVYTIYNYGKYKILPAFFLGFSLLPIDPHEFWQCNNIIQMKETLNSIVKEYATFILNNKKCIEEKPSYLIVADDGFDNHMVLNLSDNLNSYITGYKTYRQYFYLDFEKIEAKTVNILSLPKMLANKLNLLVDEYRLSHRCAWNREFEKREHHELIDLDSNGYYLTPNSPDQQIYAKAVQILNDSFKHDIGHVDELIRLEKLISLLEFTFLPYIFRQENIVEIYHLLTEIYRDNNIPEPNTFNDDVIGMFKSEDKELDKELADYVDLLEKVLKEQESFGLDEDADIE